MKKFVITIVVLVVIYFVAVAILKVTKVCPDYLNLMPGPDKSNIPAWQAIFCPFAEKSY